MIGNRSGESTSQRRHPNTPGRAFCRVFLTVGLFAFSGTTNFRALVAQSSAELVAQEKDDCTKNLKIIYEAIQAYRDEHKDLPDWLSDLVPDYLPDANVLICPVCRRTGQIEKPPLADPNIASSYLFEFCTAQLGNSAPANPTATRREWKQRQMAIVGSVVPIVRCRLHKAPLNLAFDGRIYESPPSWETMLTNTVDPKTLTIARMFAAAASGTNSAPAKRTSPKRDRKLSSQISDAALSVRVTVLDLVAANFSARPLDETVRRLKSQAPDVVLLRGIAEWKTAAQLAKALEPVHYHVVACSAFGNGSKISTNINQVAILARKTAYFSWSEPWNYDDGPSAKSGLTFAAIEIAGHRFGFFSMNVFERPNVQPISQTEAAHQLLESVNAYRGWSNNRLEGFVAATFQPISDDGEPGRLLRSAGFHDPMSDPPNTSASESIEGHVRPNADSPKGLLLSKAPITCEFDFQSPPVVVVVTNVPMPSTQTPTAPAQASGPISSMQSSIWWITGGMGALLLAIVMILLSIRQRLNRWQLQQALVPTGPYNVVIASPTGATATAQSAGSLTVARNPNLPAFTRPQELTLRQGLLRHLSEWLKQTFVQRILSDRQKLLDDQQVAARKVTSVDERLARLETKIQQQTAAYEKEIELLNQKLLSAREENLELIRSQIKFLKSEMEAARARVLEAEM
jgi:hypothetical protein